VSAVGRGQDSVASMARRRLVVSETYGGREKGRICLKRCRIHRSAEDREQERRFGEFLANPAASTRQMPVAAGRQTGHRAKGRHAWRTWTRPASCFPRERAIIAASVWAALSARRRESRVPASAVPAAPKPSRKASVPPIRQCSRPIVTLLWSSSISGQFGSPARVASSWRNTACAAERNRKPA
jgi:hypothetical protein